jgi:hypothetical protein
MHCGSELAQLARRDLTTSLDRQAGRQSNWAAIAIGRDTHLGHLRMFAKPAIQRSPGGPSTEFSSPATSLALGSRGRHHDIAKLKRSFARKRLKVRDSAILKISFQNSFGAAKST